MGSGKLPESLKSITEEPTFARRLPGPPPRRGLDEHVYLLFFREAPERLGVQYHTPRSGGRSISINEWRWTRKRLVREVPPIFRAPILVSLP